MAQYTFKQLQDKVLARLDEASNSANILTVVKDTLNECNTARASERKWPFMLVSPATLTLVPGQTAYTLPSNFFKPLYFYNKTKLWYMKEVPRTQISQLGVDWTTATSGKEFRLEGQTLRLLFTPQEADEIEYQYYKLPTLMSADLDTPDIPFPHSAILAYDALIELKAYTTEMENIGVWEQMQAKLEKALDQEDIDGQSLQAHREYVHGDDEDWD